MHLEDHIQQLIELGNKDPLEIARTIIKREPQEWVAGELILLAEDLIAEIARARVNASRRTRELALRPGDQMTSAEMKLAELYIPDRGWTRIADLTEHDLESRARMYDKLAVGSLRRAQWLRDVIDLMHKESVKTVGKLKAALPPLPDSDEITGLLGA